MALKDKIPTYHSKDFAVLTGSMLPLAMVINYFLYGVRYFHDVISFLAATIATFVFLGAAFLTYGLVAISLRNRFPNDNQFYKRLFICLSIFYLMSAIYISLLLFLYDYFDFLGYQYYENDFLKGYIAIVVINTFLTFFNEGIYRFEKYKTTVKETEQLKKEYMHSQLLGLKSQMNPHFLFNGLNTLSCLIQEDADKAEDFLDHMSKVYRYLLRNNEEQLVTLQTELGFINSYYYLLKERHCEGLHLTIKIPGELLNQMVPPLTLQMIVENSVNLNAVSKNTPLHVCICQEDNRLVVKNNIQPKVNNPEEHSEVLENISNKYRLLCQQEVIITETASERIIKLPLIKNKERAIA